MLIYYLLQRRGRRRTQGQEPGLLTLPPARAGRRGRCQVPEGVQARPGLGYHLGVGL